MKHTKKGEIEYNCCFRYTRQNEDSSFQRIENCEGFTV